MIRNLFDLLISVQQTGSIQRASQLLRFSYRYAWGLINKWEQEFSQKLLFRQKGRTANTSLTDFAEILVLEYQRLNTELQPSFEGHSRNLEQKLGIYNATSNKTFRCYASHDLALAILVKFLKKELNDTLQHETHGSLDALKQIANQHCQMIGFHYPICNFEDDFFQPYKYWLELCDVDWYELSTRSQGFIIAKNNPKKIKGVKDLTKRSIHFVNRQPDSGTRILFDQILKINQIQSDSINGYNQEEFTHNAVAAMVASGAADAALGIQAAADSFGLDFVPIIKERYLIGIHASINSKIKSKIMAILTSETFKNATEELSGYTPNDIGRPLSVYEIIEDFNSSP